MSQSAYDRIRVWHQVLADFEGQHAMTSKRWVGLDLEAYEHHIPRFETTAVEILQKDCVYAAIDQVRLGLKPLLLNMASEFKAGGGVGKGSSAQEEDLFRRSDYFLHLLTAKYPLEPVCSLTSQQVLFYRLGAQEGYERMKFPTCIDCIAAPAIRRPVTSQGGTRFAKIEDVELFRNKMRQLFDVAYRLGNDCLVLSAWGCGAFGCPTEHVAALFREVVSENQGRFKKIVFAIFDTSNFDRFKSAYSNPKID
jgi:uncharacterized protein (TIGR02452 family)